MCLCAIDASSGVKLSVNRRIQFETCRAVEEKVNRCPGGSSDVR